MYVFVVATREQSWHYALPYNLVYREDWPL